MQHALYNEENISEGATAFVVWNKALTDPRVTSKPSSFYLGQLVNFLWNRIISHKFQITVNRF